MKKLFLILLMIGSGNIYAQQYPVYPDGQMTGYNHYDDDYDYDDDFDDDDYYPKDYYYQFPADYYTDAFYRDSYRDYQRSIAMVNWDRFFVEYRLAPWQIEQIIYLNRKYRSFRAWNAYYRYNPDRWYYDRFFALRNILGPQIYIIFGNSYYGGLSPVVYYHRHRVKYYRPVVFVRPQYRNININIYHVSPRDYHKEHGYFYSPGRGFGFKDAPKRPAGVASGNNGFRGPSSGRNDSGNSGFRGQTSRENSRADRDFSGEDGFRRNRGNQQKSPQIMQPQKGNEGFRGRPQTGDRKPSSERSFKKSKETEVSRTGNRFAARD